MEPSPGFSPPCAWGPFSCTTDSLLVEDLLEKPELLSQISRGKRLSIIYTLRLMQIPRPSSLLCWKLLRRHEAHKLFPSLPAFSIFWMVTKRQVFANLTNQSSLSALLSSCPSHQCHHMSLLAPANLRSTESVWPTSASSGLIGKTLPTFWFYTVCLEQCSSGEVNYLTCTSFWCSGIKLGI